MFHQTVWRDREEGCACPPSRALRRGGRATGKPQGVGPEAYLNGTSQGAAPEDARLPARRAYSSERRAAISVVAVTPRRESHETSGLGTVQTISDASTLLSAVVIIFSISLFMNRANLSPFKMLQNCIRDSLSSLTRNIKKADRLDCI